jgi:hypothetical protein
MSQDFETQHKVETYKSLIQISLEALRFLALVNGGAAIALINYITSGLQKTGHAPDARLPMGFFLGGLVCCGVAFFSSYCTQNILFNEAMGRSCKNSHLWPLGISVAFFIGGLGCFAAGCWFSIQLTAT